MAGVINKTKEKVEDGEKAPKETVGEVVGKVKKAMEGKAKSAKKPSKKTPQTPAGKLEKKAEAESNSGEADLEAKKKALLERVKKLKEKIETEDVSSEELKEQVKIKKKSMLIPLEEYVKAGIYLGTKVVTPDMRPFVYRRRADGLAIFNTDLIDEKIREGVEFLSKFAPEDVIVVCKREAGWRAVRKFGEITGIKVFTKKYPAGVLTNKQLPEFFENELTVITDQWIDKNALADTLNVHKKVLMICDTNNFSKGADQIILGNNKSPKSIGIIYYLLAKGYTKARKIKVEVPDLEWWTGEMEESERESETLGRGKEIVAEAEVMAPEESYGV